MAHPMGAVKKASPHQQALCLTIQGLPADEIAVVTGIPAQAILHILKSPLAVAEIARRMGMAKVA